MIPTNVEAELDTLFKKAWVKAGNKLDEFINSPAHQRYATLMDELRAHTPSEEITLVLEPMSTFLKKLPNFNPSLLEVCSQYGGSWLFLKLDFNRATNFNLSSYKIASTFENIESFFDALKTLLDTLPNSVTLIENRYNSLNQLFGRFNQAAHELGISPIDLNRRYRIRKLLPEILKKLSSALESVQEKEGTERYQELIQKHKPLLDELELSKSFIYNQDSNLADWLTSIAVTIKERHRLFALGLTVDDVDSIKRMASKRYRPTFPAEKTSGKQDIVRIFNALIQHHSSLFEGGSLPKLESVKF